MEVTLQVPFDEIEHEGHKKRTETENNKMNKRRPFRDIKEETDNTRIFVYGQHPRGGGKAFRVIEMNPKNRHETLLGSTEADIGSDSIIYLQNRLYFFGFTNKSIYSFDLDKKTFFENALPAIPLEDQYHKVVASEEEILVVGGYNESFEKCQNSSAIYSLKTGQWKIMPEPKYARYGHGLAWAPDIGLALVVGGNPINGKSVEGMWRDWRDPDDTANPPKWLQFQDAMMSVSPYSMTYFRGNFVIAAGFADGCCSGFVFSFKPPASPTDMEGNSNRGTWCRLPNIYQQVEFTSLVGTRNRIYGFSNNSKLFRFRQVKEETTEESKMYYRCWDWRLAKLMLNFSSTHAAVAAPSEDI